MSKQQGFTLIELLVVIAILGVIVAVVALNVAGFFGRGTLQAANTELHQVNTAIVTYISSTGGNDWSFNATISPDSNHPVNATLTDNSVHKFIGSPGMLQAAYLIVSGSVVNATPVEDSKWGELHFCSGAWQEEECA